jgi:hypothetical protein
MRTEPQRHPFPRWQVSRSPPSYRDLLSTSGAEPQPLWGWRPADTRRDWSRSHLDLVYRRYLLTYPPNNLFVVYVAALSVTQTRDLRELSESHATGCLPGCFTCNLVVFNCVSEEYSAHNFRGEEWSSADIFYGDIWFILTAFSTSNLFSYPEDGGSVFLR